MLILCRESQISGDLTPVLDSNPQPTDSKSGTLSIELRGRALRDIIALIRV